MSRQSQGLQYENDLSADIHENTPPTVRTYRCGYSGNGRIPQPDVLISTNTINLALEIKTSSQDRFYIDSEDLEQLHACVNEKTHAVLVMKFSYREPVTVKLPWTAETDVAELAGEAADAFPEQFEPNATRTGNLSLTKPASRDWASSRSGRSDHDAVIASLRLSYRHQR